MNLNEEFKKLILELAPTLGFDKPADGQKFDDWLEGLHNYLDSMAEDFNTFGLHTLGKVLNGTELVEEVITINELLSWMGELNEEDTDFLIEEIDRYFRIEMNMEFE